MPDLLHPYLTRQVSMHRLGIPTADDYLALSSLTSLRISKPYTSLIPYPFSRVDLTLSPIPSTRSNSITITFLPPLHILQPSFAIDVGLLPASHADAYN